jgi:hypothetical protein
MNDETQKPTKKNKNTKGGVTRTIVFDESSKTSLHCQYISIIISLLILLIVIFLFLFCSVVLLCCDLM